ncbi:hypothetical protein [Bordetella genomosp. 13]|uniref:hypothetical protein n=1 Tax=Bordetella genomosp. 13 TaxID=463040 RepID=UPI0011AAD3E9|nr:hypothetical protein [Bordetella genomosp. 13]
MITVHRLGAVLLLASGAASAHAQVLPPAAQPSGSTPARVYSTGQQPAYTAPPGGNIAMPPIPRQPGQPGALRYQPPPAVPVQPSRPSAPTLPSRPSQPSAPSAGLPSARPSYTPAPAAPMAPAPRGGSSTGSSPYGR